MAVSPPGATYRYTNMHMNDASRYAALRKELDPETLIAQAQRESGLTEFGDRYFVGRMARMLDRAAHEVDFTAEGLKAYQGDLNRFLINRLRTHADIQRHPEILNEDVSDPLIIIGVPRSGTTKLQRMMANDPNIQKLYMWQMWNPARFPDAIAGQPDPRMAAVGIGVGNNAVAGDEAARAQAMAQAAHVTAMAAVEEEFVLFDFLFDETVAGFNTQIPLIAYAELDVGKPDSEAVRRGYDYVKTLLQYRQWQDGGRGGNGDGNRPWLLKAVIHHPNMETLLECFPKATLVHCHRDPHESIPSITKLMWANWTTKARVDIKHMGRELFEWGSRGIARYLDTRKRLHLDYRILDVRYDSIRNDVMTVIHDVYRHAGWTLTAEAEQAMTKWEADNEQGKHGQHTYSLEETGLTSGLIDQAFAEYTKRFVDGK